MKIRIGDFKTSPLQKKYVKEIMNSNRITEGPFVEKLERTMENYLGVKHAIAVTNGTVALQLVSQYLGKDNTVCVPALTFPATLNAFEVTGQKTMLCDIDTDLLIDIRKLSVQEKKKIDVLVPVHLMGYPCDMEFIMAEAKLWGWKIVEDCAEAFGAEHYGKKVGTFGDFGTYSFYVSHNLSAGELGLVVTNNDRAAEVMRSMKNHGRIGDNLKFLHDYIGSNYKTTEFCAALCLAEMSVADTIIQTRFNNCLKMQDEITNTKLKPFSVSIGYSPLGYPIKAVSESYKDYICEKLNNAGVETRDMFPCLARQLAFMTQFKKDRYEVANEMQDKCFYVGCHQHMTEEELNHMIAVMNEVQK